MFNVISPIPKFLKSYVIYKFVCPGCNACYIGETSCHLSTRIKEHLEADKKCHSFAHAVHNENCQALSTKNCFEVIASASSSFRLKLKEAMRTIWKNPSLNKQQKHVSISITVLVTFYLELLLRFYSFISFYSLQFITSFLSI